MRISWIKTKVQAFVDILNATVESIPVNSENVEVTQTFTYFGRVIHSSTSCGLEVKPRLGQAWIAMNSLEENMWRCRFVQKDQGTSVSLAGPSGLAVFL